MNMPKAPLINSILVIIFSVSMAGFVSIGPAMVADARAFASEDYRLSSAIGDSSQLPELADQAAPQVVGPALPVASTAHPFGNPASGSISASVVLSPGEILANVQCVLGDEFDLAERRPTYIWNGEPGTMLDVTEDKHAYEFVFNGFRRLNYQKGSKENCAA